jgi:hypothetical protein
VSRRLLVALPLLGSAMGGRNVSATTVRVAIEHDCSTNAYKSS